MITKPCIYSTFFIKMPLRYDGLSNRRKFLLAIEIVQQRNIGSHAKRCLCKQGTAPEEEKNDESISQ